jgi:DNA-binding SARP family transcriptional activator
MTSDGERPAELCVLGRVRATVDGHTVEVTSKLTATLLSLLVIHRPIAMREEDLIQEMWLGSPPTEAGSAFRTYLATARKILGKKAIVTKGATYRLDENFVSVDLDRVHSALSLVVQNQTILEKVDALGKIQASLRVDFFGGSEYAEPIVDESRYLQELADATRMDWLEARLEAGESARVCPDLRRLVAADPENERCASMLMKALSRSGDRTGALNVFRDLHRALSEHGMTPGPDVSALEYQILLQSTARAAIPGMLSLPASAEAAALDFAGRADLVEELARPELTSAVIIGDSCTGKTAIAARVARTLNDYGVRVHYASAAANPHPLGMFVEALPALQPLIALGDDALVTEEILRIANEGPGMCLVIDDLQAAHDRALLILRNLSASQQGHVLLRMFTTPGHDFSEITNVRFSLPPMSRSDIELVLRKRLGKRPDPAAVDWVFEVSAGWVGAVSVMTGYLAIGGTLGESTTSHIPAFDLVFVSFGTLGRQVLGSLAYADVVVDPAKLSALTNLPVMVATEIIERARSLHILMPTGPPKYRNDLYARHAENELDVTQRRLLSAAIAEDSSFPLWDRARHALQIAEPGNWPATVQLTLDACREANRSHQAPATVSLVKHALEKTGILKLSAVDLFHLLDAASVAEELLGDVDAATARRKEAFEVAERNHLVEEALSCALRGPASGRSISDDVQRSLVRRALELEIPGTALGDQLLAESVFTTLFLLDHPSPLVIDSIERLEWATQTASDPLTLAMVHRALYLSRIAGLSNTELASHVDLLLLNSARCSHLDLRSMALVYGVRHAMATGTEDDILKAVARHESFAAESGRPADIWARDAIQATWLQMTGRHHQSRSKAEVARSFGMKYAAGDTELAWLLFQLSTVAMNGHPTEQQDEATIRAYPLWGPLFLDAPTLPGSDSAGALRGLVDTFINLHHNISTLATIAWATELLWTTRNTQPAEALLNKLDSANTGERFIVVGHLPVATAGPVSRVRALLLALMGKQSDHDEIVELFKQSFAISQDLGARGWTVRVLMDQATFYRSVGNEKDAIRSLDNATAIAAFEHPRNAPRMQKLIRS